jgi:hypothetical protein
MLVSVSAKRPEGNAESDVGRSVKRAKLSADPSEKDKTPGDSDSGTDEGLHTAEGPSDLYLDTVGPVNCSAQMSSLSYFRLTEQSLISILRKSARSLCQT